MEYKIFLKDQQSKTKSAEKVIQYK